MTSPTIGQAALVSVPPKTGTPDFSYVELSPAEQAELLDPSGWADILETYARTMKLAVALTNVEGRMLGICHNPQPVWSLARESAQNVDRHCSFCLTSNSKCSAAAESLTEGGPVIAHDFSGLAHVAVPLSLGDQKLGALLAGQVFDRYPEPLPLERVAKQFGIAPQLLWQQAIQQKPISPTTLRMYGDLLAALADSFLRQRYAVILDRKLIKTDQRYRVLIDGVKDYALFTVDRGGLITSWNSGAETLYYYTEAEIMGEDFSVLFAPEDVETGEPGKLLQKALRGGSTNDEGWQMRRDGTRFFASGLLAPLGQGDASELGRLLRDITERRKAEAAMMQAHKLESIGVLAGGIAHDFNNLLAGILFSVSCAKASVPPEDPAFAMLELAEQSTEKAAALTNQLLAYAGKGKFVIARFDFSTLISEMLPLIHTAIPKHVRLDLKLPAGLPWIEADASQIQQIVMNLIINGAEAIGPEGGTLSISTGASGVNDGRSVYMEVQDSGSGMDDATKARIFDPFFTTKFSGRGLGLAAVSGIIRGHNGRMELESAPGHGTTFKIFFPAVEPIPTGGEVAAADSIRGSGSILVVDDEPLLRELVKAILERCGYSVLVAENGRDAVSVLREKGGEIAAVVLDLTMPVMGGEEAFRQLREIRPDLPILISSGYGEFFARQQFDPADSLSFLQKPYTPAKLTEKLSQMIVQAPHN